MAGSWFRTRVDYINNPVRGERQEVRRFQIIVWVSVSAADALEWDPRIPAFPAILDPGNNFNLTIFQSQLIRWAGIRPELLRLLGTIKTGKGKDERRYPRHEADVWLHANEPSFEVAAGILCSQQAFWRNLPELLKKGRNHGRWVCYHGEELVGIARTKTELIRECLRRGLPDDAYFTTIIRPQDLPPWEPEEIEPIHNHHFEENSNPEP